MSDSDPAGTAGGRRFRVLSLDGGGIKGTYTASVLASLEEMTGKKIREHFDLITGTSTGGIIAVALGLDVPIEEILTLYSEHGPEIFPRPSTGVMGKLKEKWRHVRGPKHCQETLSGLMEQSLGKRLFGESKTRLVIPAFDAVRGKPQLFKTAHAPAYLQDYKLLASTVALGTSAAPTYYPAYSDANGACFLDGGVWANSPVVVGLLEATCVLKWPIEQVDLLSIGTTQAPFDVSHAKRNGGVAQWNFGLIELFTEAQVDAALGQARLMTDNRMLRIDTATRPGRFSLDNSSEINDLKALGQQAARLHERVISERFLSSKAEDFLPCYPAAAAPGADQPLQESCASRTA